MITAIKSSCLSCVKSHDECNAFHIIRIGEGVRLCSVVARVEDPGVLVGSGSEVEKGTYPV